MNARSYFHLGGTRPLVALPIHRHLEAVARGAPAAEAVVSPRYMRIVDAFPMTVTGKIQKFRIRELIKAEERAKASRAVADAAPTPA